MNATAPPPPWNITLLGGLSAQHADRTITRFATQKTAALPAYLAYHRQQAHPREALIELLWPSSEPAAGRNRLSTALSSLRNQFEPPGTPASSVLRADRFSVGLNPAMVTTDVARFGAAIAVASKASSGVERVQCLQEAIALYSGPLLPGFYEEWITGQQERLSGMFLRTALANAEKRTRRASRGIEASTQGGGSGADSPYQNIQISSIRPAMAWPRCAGRRAPHPTLPTLSRSG